MFFESVSKLENIISCLNSHEQFALEYILALVSPVSWHSFVWEASFEFKCTHAEVRKVALVIRNDKYDCYKIGSKIFDVLQMFGWSLSLQCCIKLKTDLWLKSSSKIYRRLFPILYATEESPWFSNRTAVYHIWSLNFYPFLIIF